MLKNTVSNTSLYLLSLSVCNIRRPTFGLCKEVPEVDTTSLLSVEMLEGPFREKNRLVFEHASLSLQEDGSDMEGASDGDEDDADDTDSDHDGEEDDHDEDELMNGD